MLIPAKALFLVVAGMRVQKIRLRFLFLWRALFSFISARQRLEESEEKYEKELNARQKSLTRRANERALSPI